jgi:competence protein ComEA
VVAETRDDEVDVDRAEDELGAVRGLSRTLTQTVVPWIRFVGPVRLLGAVGAMLVVAGIAWWMLRAPALPTESRLPMAQRAGAAELATSSASLVPSTVVPAPPTSATVVIHVTGAVHAPGVYELRPGQRVADAIDAAGGALADGDANALNLAAPVADGDRIAVPTVGEAPSSPSAGAGAGHSHAGDPAAGPVSGSPVDLNTAGVAELEALPGIGPATAAAIVDHRAANGPYATVDDVEAVRGIGPAKLEAIRDYVTV